MAYVRVQYLSFCETPAERQTFALAVEGGNDPKHAAEIAWSQLQRIDNPLSIERMFALGFNLKAPIRSASVGDVFTVSEFSFQLRRFTDERIFLCDNVGMIEIDKPTLERYLKMESRDMSMGWDWCKSRLPAG